MIYIRIIDSKPLEYLVHEQFQNLYFCLRSVFLLQNMLFIKSLINECLHLSENN